MPTFLHQPKPGIYKRFTLALNLPEKLDLIAAAKSFVEGNEAVLMMSMGIAKVNPKDQFNRTKGREISESRLVPVRATVKELHTSGKQVYLTLDIPELTEVEFRLGIYYHRDSDETRGRLVYEGPPVSRVIL